MAAADERLKGTCRNSGPVLAAGCSQLRGSSLGEQPEANEENIDEGWELCGDDDDIGAWELCDYDALSAASSEWLDLADLPEDDELLGAWLAAPRGAGGSAQVRGEWAQKAEALPNGSNSRGTRPPSSGTRVPPLCKSRRQPPSQSGEEGLRPTCGEGHGQDKVEVWTSRSTLPFRSQPRRKRKK